MKIFRVLAYWFVSFLFWSSAVFSISMNNNGPLNACIVRLRALGAEEQALRMISLMDSNPRAQLTAAMKDTSDDTHNALLFLLNQEDLALATRMVRDCRTSDRIIETVWRLAGEKGVRPKFEDTNYTYSFSEIIGFMNVFLYPLNMDLGDLNYATLRTPNGMVYFTLDNSVPPKATRVSEADLKKWIVGSKK